MFRALSARSAALLLVTSLVASSVPAAAQRPGGGTRRGGDAMTDVELGVQPPDVKVYDANGKARSIRDLLAGHTTAIVFGCLT